MPTLSRAFSRASLLLLGAGLGLSPHLATAVASKPAALAAAGAPAGIKILINPGDQGATSRFAVFSQWRDAVQQGVAKVDPGGAQSVSLSTDSTADLSATRAGLPDVVVGPAQLIGSAVRYGYAPVAGLQQKQQAVMVVAADSPIHNFSEMRGARLGLPPQDSLVTYLVRGEVIAADTTLKRHFASVYETRYQDALLTCLKLRRCDVIAVERSLFDRWKAAAEPVRMVMESHSVPAISIAVKLGSNITQAALRKSFAEAYGGAGNETDRGATGPVNAEDFTYVSTLGYFTPRDLQKATVVDAATVERLLKEGAHYIDTRNAAEFAEGHVPQAVLVPYVEKSAKDPDFVAAQDTFDINQLDKNHNAAVIFGCNGAECWKSYKASIAAIKAGYTKIYWFRGGFPEWRRYRSQLRQASGQDAIGQTTSVVR